MRKNLKSPASRPLTPQELGNAGEARFGELCDLGKLVANKSTRNDTMGWDYLVEVPFNSLRGDEPFDMRRKVPDMKVQVKTIWADNHSVDVKLIAVERLARWEYPSFIVILRMNTDKTFLDGYVIHLLDDNLGRVLKALREAEARKAMSIKHQTLTFNISSGKAIRIDGDELAKALCDAVGPDQHSYTTRKRDQLANLGFSAQRFRGQMQFVAKDNDELLDIFLGVKAGQASTFELDDVRFDIRAPVSRETNVRVEVKPESKGPGQLVISSVREGKRAIFNTELYFAGLGGPNDPWKLRAKSDVVDLIVSSETTDATFNFSVSEDQRHTLDEWISITQLQLIMSMGRSVATIQKQGRKVISFSVESLSGSEKSLVIQDRFKLLYAFRDLMAEIGLRDIRITNRELFDNWSAINFVIFTQRPDNDLTISASFMPTEDFLEVLDVVEGLCAAKMEFDTIKVGFWARMHLSVQKEDDLLRFKCRDFVLRDLNVVESDQAFITWIAEASEATGLELVLRYENFMFKELEDGCDPEADEPGRIILPGAEDVGAARSCNSDQSQQA